MMGKEYRRVQRRASRCSIWYQSEREVEVVEE
jgi:hypothetical protein